MTQWTRNIWLSGNDTEEPTVSVPLSWISIVGPADFADAVDGLNFKVWLYWDRALLMKRQGRLFQVESIPGNVVQHTWVRDEESRCRGWKQSNR
ncbi:hypothetical protein N7467_010040 [Penicillium canescens]|nr:hypothetical protein N7467_010040 [Penicillium canescens]